MPETSATSASIAGSVGLVVDRTLEAVLCTAWMIGANRAVTVASALVPFANHLNGLSISFPKAGRQCAISKITFHPRFDLELVQKQLRRGISFDSWEAALQKHNCAILHLSDELPELTAADLEAVTRALAPQVSGDGFSGSLKNIELPLVLQTLTGAKQEGVLYVCDDTDRAAAQLLFKDGKLLSARYKNLSNETAIYQMVQKQVNGRFFFRNSDISDWLEWLPAGPITYPQDMILIESMRRFDERAKFKDLLQVNNTYFVRARSTLDTGSLPEEIRDAAELLWRVLDGMTAADDLWLLLGADDYHIYSVLHKLDETDQLRRVQDGGTRQMPASAVKQASASKWTPLPVGPELPLEPLEHLTAIGIDVDATLVANSRGMGGALRSRLGKASVASAAANITGTHADESLLNDTTTKVRLKSGQLLGAIDAYDSSHLLHEIPLLPQAGGVPILKEGVVIGMHCGVVPFSFDQDNSTGIKQLMVWIDVVLEALKAAGEDELVRRVTQQVSVAADESKKRIRPAGCSEIASLACPGCGAETFDTARSCPKCKRKFIPGADVAVQVASKPTRVMPPRDISLNLPLTVVAALSAVGLLMILSSLFASESVAIAVPQLTVKEIRLAEPSEMPVLLRTMRQVGSVKAEDWQALPKFATLNNDERIKFRVDAFQPSYVYLFVKSQWAEKASLIFPPAAGVPNLIETKQALNTGKFKVQPPKGSETILVVASKKAQPWLVEPSAANAVFDLAQQLPQGDGSRSGFLVTVEKPNDSGTTEKSADGEANLFLSSVSVNHF